MNLYSRIYAVLAVGLMAVVGAKAQSNGAAFTNCYARVAGDQVVVQWQTSRESGVAAFDVERKGVSESTYRRVGRVAPKGSGAQYSFVDNSAFFRTADARQYQYRIRAVGGSDVYSSIMTVALEVAGVKKSWGMIKELFR